MDPKVLRDRISKADHSIFQDMKAIPDEDYSQLSDLAASKNPEVREVLVRFALSYQKEWSKKILFTLIRAPETSVRSMAAAGLKERAKPADGKPLLKELELQLAQKPVAELAKLELSLAIGNSGDKETMEPLLGIRKLENDPEIGEAMDMALAKLGYVKELRRMEGVLDHGTPVQIKQALAEIEYIGSPEWTAKVVPLLADDRVAEVKSLGPVSFRFKVCDLAINTLILIDPKKRMPFPRRDSDSPYKAEDHKKARMAYGLK